MPSALRKRGRPKTAGEQLRADMTIGRTVWQLMHWGFKLRSVVLPLVARNARAVLGRNCSDGLPLSVERIEQIYERWASNTPSGWVRNGSPITFASIKKPSVYMLDWRESTRPKGKTLDELANALLKNEGYSPYVQHGPAGGYGDPQLTVKARNALSWAPRFSCDESTPEHIEKPGN